MLIIRILTYLRGFVRISVSGRFTERFLNICGKKNIYIWNIQNRGNGLIHLNMSVKGFKTIVPVAGKSKTRVHIISRCGLPFFLKKHRKRKMFFAAAVAAVLLLAYITSFVWVIEVNGNEKLDDGVILDALAKNGFKIGTLRYGNDIFDLQNKMLLEIDELSWLWVDIKGTRALVEVKEKTPVPQIVDRSRPCNIVAKTDGLIIEFNATYGEKLAAIGDVVKKGDLLIGGISSTKYGGIHYLHSAGVIKARTWHTKTGDFPLKKINFSKTGKKFSKNTINFFGFRVKLYSDGKMPYADFEEEEKIHRFSIGENFVFPISVERKIYHELSREEETISNEAAEAEAVERLSDELESELSTDTVIVSKNHSAEFADGESVTVRVDYECVEDIGREIPIDVQ